MAIFGVNFPRYWINPRNAFSSFAFSGGFISATTSSMLVIGKCSLLIASFKSRGSMHMRSLLGFTTATMPFTQSVGSFCLTATSAVSIRLTSSSIFSLRETGTFRGGCTTVEMLESRSKVFAGLGTKYCRSVHFNYMEIYFKSVAFFIHKVMSLLLW